MAQTQTQLAQTKYLMNGGLYELPMQQMREKGILPSEYVYHEYPKMVRISQGMQTFDRSTEDHKGRTISWTETKEVFTDTIVNSVEEEERVLSGGMTSAQIEEERQSLILRCRALGIVADPSWSVVRLRRELGDKLDAPDPADKMGALEAELESLRKMAAMQAEIDALRAQMAKPADDVAEMRAALTERGVKVDGRWSAQRLREELDHLENV